MMTINKTAAILISLALLATMGLGCAATPKSQPEVQLEASWQFHDIVDVDFVRQYVTVPRPEGVMLIDARPARPKYDKGHIPTAVSMPDSRFDKMTAELPEDKGTLLIFYCGGVKCKLSHKSAVKAEQLGYTNVKVFAAGFPAWMKVPGNYASVSTDWVKKQIDNKADMVLVDSRPRRPKYDKGHIPTAISIPDTQFERFKDQLPADKSQLLVFYCGGFKCKLSHKSAHKAIDMGYTHVKVFAAGYPAWKAVAGNRAAGSPAGAPAIKTGKEEGSIDPAVFKKILSENPDSIYLMDVRDPDEYSTGSFKTAVNMPVDKLEDQIASLPVDKPIVFVCGTGARSGEAYYMVQDLRPKLKTVFYLEGELTFNKDGSFTITEAL